MRYSCVLYAPCFDLHRHRDDFLHRINIFFAFFLSVRRPLALSGDITYYRLNAAFLCSEMAYLPEKPEAKFRNRCIFVSVQCGFDFLKLEPLCTCRCIYFMVNVLNFLFKRYRLHDNPNAINFKRGKI